MKKYFVTAVMMMTICISASAQEENAFTVNSRAWCTNYFTTAIYGLAESLVKEFAADDNTKAEKIMDHIIPDPDLVFPVGMGKSGFDENGVGDIYGPYHRAFGNPFKHIGDYAIGVDASYKSSILGFYAGAYFKSQEVVFKETDENIRGFYFQPRAGLIMGSQKHAFEAGIFYDVVTGCGGSINNTDKDMLKGGLGLDFAFSTTDKKDKTKTLLQFSMPLHNFFNTDHAGQSDLKRKVGYIMLTQRIIL